MRAASELSIPLAQPNWRELVRSPEVDAVVIGTWPYLHCPVTLAALDAGKHVLCQARMAMDSCEAHRMLDASRSRPDLVAQLVPSPMTLGVDAYIRRLIADGFLGDVLSVEVRDCSGFVDRDSPMHWRQDLELSGCNTMSLGIWYEAIMRWIGDAERVTAMGRVFAAMRRDESGLLRAVRVPDHLDAVAGMTCGAQALFRISKVTGFAPPTEVWLFGSEGTLQFSESKLYGGRRGGQMEELTVPPELQAGWRVESDFVESIRTGKPVTLTSFETGVRYMEFTEAALRASIQGQVISLPLT